jgi:pimeloyl-ACP methyl ester carboxylesterase
MVHAVFHRIAAAVVVVCCALSASCQGGSGDDDDEVSQPTAPPETTTSPAGQLAWDDCGDVECATLEVPADYAEAEGATIELALARRPADGDRVGALLLNPGGPGAAGIPLVEDASSYVSDELLERFDIVAWDPRGVGESTAIECIDNLDFFFATDKSPDDQGEVDANIAAARQLVEACKARSGELLPHLSSRATVDDMDSIRAALGEEKLTYAGFSYGTYLGALYAEHYPDKVRALVLDGAVDPSLGFEDLSREQAAGFDSALEAFLDYCADEGCGFGGDDPHAAYDQLIAQIDAETLPGEIEGEERTLGPGEADIGVATALYLGEDGWDLLGEALNSAARGDGSGLLILSDAYTSRHPGGDYDNNNEAFYGIGCLDGPAPSAEDLPAVAQRVAQVAPEFGASTTWLSSPCSVWPVPPVGTPGPLQGAGAPPIVVIGTSNDPATPLKWARSLADQLESARLVVFEGEGHTAYQRGSSCVDEIVDRYLVDLTVPGEETTC